ncbi:hypothetical protein KCV07_g3776, partial [Aureobasidium melanogenum]
MSNRMLEYFDMFPVSLAGIATQLFDTGHEALNPIMEAAIQRRSVERYLLQKFGTGAELLEVMSKHYAYISGSRALGFFIFRGAKSTSDWDFYVPRNPYVVNSFMLELSKLGVTWTGPLKKLEELLSTGLGKEVVFTQAQYRHHYLQGDFQRLAERFGFDPGQLPAPPALLAFNVSQFSPNKPWLAISVSWTGFHTRYWREADRLEPFEQEYSPRCLLIEGSLNGPEGEVKVQLIVEHRNDVFNYPSLMTFHSSCVQSFIGPHFSCHLYGRMACDCETYAWRLDEPGIEKAHKKYQDRLFKYIDMAAGSRKLRSALDDEAVTVPRDGPTQAPGHVIKMYEAGLERVAWTELTNSIEPVPAKKDKELDVVLASDSWFTNDLGAATALVELGVLPCLPE